MIRSTISMGLACVLICGIALVGQGPAADEAQDKDNDGFQMLFNGVDLTGWDNGAGSPPSPNWKVEDGALVRSPRAGYIWSKERFADFVLDLEFKTEGNSGVFFRTDNPRNCVQTGIEMQVLPPVGRVTKNSCGSIYDAMAPSKEVTKKDQWNRVVITAIDNRITVVMNGEKIIDMDLNGWTEPNQNPDGTKNKFSTALKDFKRDGHVGFQDHGHAVSFRNVKIKRVKAK